MHTQLHQILLPSTGFSVLTRSSTFLEIQSETHELLEVEVFDTSDLLSNHAVFNSKEMTKGGFQAKWVTQGPPQGQIPDPGFAPLQPMSWIRACFPCSVILSELCERPSWVYFLAMPMKKGRNLLARECLRREFQCLRWQTNKSNPFSSVVFTDPRPSPSCNPLNSLPNTCQNFARHSINGINNQIRAELNASYTYMAMVGVPVTHNFFNAIFPSSKQQKWSRPFGDPGLNSINSWSVGS